jgi:hypothetical protein
MQVTELVRDKLIRITFAGSFQCRLATDGAPQGASPNEPVKTFPDRTGWTFAWYEQPVFDRVIRLSNPVQLRSALVDPWEDAEVTKVEVSASALELVGGYWGPDVEIKGDPLLGQVVSLGQAKFNSSAQAGGGGIGYEVLDDFALSIGGLQFAAKQAKKTRLTGVNWLSEQVQTHYKKTKVEAIFAAGAMHPARRAYMTKYDSEGDRFKAGKVPTQVDSYASFYAAEADMPNIPLSEVQINANVGVLGAAKKVADRLGWTLSLNFSRFDGDTLVGRIKGVLQGSDAQLDRGGPGTRG